MNTSITDSGGADKTITSSNHLFFDPFVLGKFFDDYDFPGVVI
jgi:hypothetical protein